MTPSTAQIKVKDLGRCGIIIAGIIDEIGLVTQIDKIISKHGNQKVTTGQVANGNEADKSIFPNLIQEFRQEWDIETLFVADAALYSTENIQQIDSLRWLSRVPATIKEATILLTLANKMFEAKLNYYSSFSDGLFTIFW